MKPLDAREWLESHVRAGSDFARDALADLDAFDELEATPMVDQAEYDEVETKLAVFENLMETDSLAKEFGDLQAVLDFARRQEALVDNLEGQTRDLAHLAMDAGLIERGDYETDPLPLIRMFLPMGDE